MMTVGQLRKHLKGRDGRTPVFFRTKEGEYPFFDGPPHLERVEREDAAVVAALVFASDEPGPWADLYADLED